MVVVLAQEEARELRHGYIGSEHILLGLIREEEGVAASVLASLGVSLENVLAHVVRIIGSGQAPVDGQIPFTPRAKRILELSLREALALDHHYIGTEHILLGLLRANEGVAERVLFDLGADSEMIRDAVIRSLSDRDDRAERDIAMERGVGPELAMHRIDSAWFDWIARSIDELATEIRQRHGRNPDSGDLLIVLASASDTVAGEMLRRLGLDSDRLADSAQAARRSRAADDPYAQIESLRQSKGEALESKDFSLAASLRDEERRLTQKRRREQAAALQQIRIRLGLAERRTGD